MRSLPGGRAARRKGRTAEAGRDAVPPEAGPHQSRRLSADQEGRHARGGTSIYRELKEAGIASYFDQQAAIGRRYRRQDEIGTPYCITVDGETAKDGTVTLRDRDTLVQDRVAAKSIVEEINRRLRGRNRG